MTSQLLHQQQEIYEAEDKIDSHVEAAKQLYQSAGFEAPRTPVSEEDLLQGRVKPMIMTWDDSDQDDPETPPPGPPFIPFDDYCQGKERGHFLLPKYEEGENICSGCGIQYDVYNTWACSNNGCTIAVCDSCLTFRKLYESFDWDYDSD